MHRSGTSALTGALQASGIALGGPLMASDQHNEKGYQELEAAVRIHEDFLGHFLLDGASLAVLPESWEKSGAAETARVAIRELFQQQFSGEKLWALKDPRLCRTLPLWRQALADDRLRAVLALRHPLEVANSLLTRNNFSINRTLLLWMQHVIEAEKSTRGMIRSKILYDELIDDVVAVVERVKVELEIEWQLPDEERHRNLNAWIDPRLKHQHAPPASVPASAFPPLVEIAVALYRVYEEPGILRNTEKLDQCYGEFMQMLSRHYGHLMQTEIERFEGQLAFQGADLAQRNEEIVRLRETLSWKITTPLRTLGNFVGYSPAEKGSGN